MGFPFMMWGGGDGSSDVARRGEASEPGAMGSAGAMGAAGAMGQGGRGMSEEEQIYGPRPDQPTPGQYGDTDPVDRDGRQQGWDNEEFAPDGEEVMEDPWSEEPSEGGMFGGFFDGSGGGGGGGSDFGDWS